MPWNYLKRNSLTTEGTKVNVTAEKVKGPFRLDNFRVDVDVPADLSNEQMKGLEEAVHRCLIHNTLLHPPAIRIDVTQSVAATL